MIADAGAMDVYFEDEIEILVASPEGFRLTAAEKILQEAKVEFSGIEAQ